MTQFTRKTNNEDWVQAGDINTLQEAIEQQSFNVMHPAFGATGDGVTDDTVAIQAAIDAAAVNGGMVLLPAKTFKVTTLVIKSRVTLQGAASAMGRTLGPVLLGTAGSDVLTVSTSLPAGSFNIFDLTVDGGRHGLATNDTVDYVNNVNIARCQFINASDAQIYLIGWSEEWYLDHVRLTAGQYGFRVANGAGTNGADKMTFKDVLTNGQTVNAWRWECETSGSCTWINPIINTTKSHGFYIDSGITGWVFINANTEGNGQGAKNARTTGSITSGTASLVVADATGFAEGDGITIQGAGPNFGHDLTTTIVTINGTTFTLATNAGTTVTGLAVTNATVDDFYLANSIASPNNITFIGGLIGGEGTGGKLRYSINNSVGATIHAYGLVTLSGIPIYDPTRRVLGVGSHVVRHPKSRNFFSPYLCQFSDKAEENWMASPAGKDLELWLRDSVGDGSGARGAFGWYRLDPNRTLLMSLDDDGNLVQSLSTGKMQIGGALDHDGSTAGFYGTAPITKQTGVAVDVASIHAALVDLGLIGA